VWTASILAITIGLEVSLSEIMLMPQLYILPETVALISGTFLLTFKRPFDVINKYKLIVVNPETDKYTIK
jgi:hypothetical protein